MKKARLGILLFGSLLPLQFPVAHAAVVAVNLSTDVNQDQVTSGTSGDVWTSPSIPIPDSPQLRAGDQLVVENQLFVNGERVEHPILIRDVGTNDSESYGVHIPGQQIMWRGPGIGYWWSLIDLSGNPLADVSGTADLNTSNGTLEISRDVELTDSALSFQNIRLTLTLPPGSGQWEPESVQFSVGADDITVVPIPAALPLFGTAMAITGFIGWRNRRRAQ